jgi:ferredoxin-NADP reductase
MITFDTEVTDIIQRTPSIKSFRFKAKEGAEFKAGQFFFVTIKVDGAERTKHFSFSNSPTEQGCVEFTKRMTDSDYSKALNNLGVGDWARLKMPHGVFTLDNSCKKMAFLSGGIGITPIRSMCKYAVDKKLPCDIILLYSNKTEQDIAFRKDFDAIQEANRHVRVVHTLTEVAPDDTTWRGRRGRVDQAMIREEIPDFRERIFYSCGPPPMVTAMVEILATLGIAKDRIRTENFSGYSS